MQPALPRLHLAIGLLVVWCASGLVALDMSVLFPSCISPFLSHLTTPIISCGPFLLLVAPFAAHATGTLAFHNYKFWQPGRGGLRFVFAQTAGWSLIAAGILLLLLWLVDHLRAFHPPGTLIGIALISLAGNAALLGSLHLYKDSGEPVEPHASLKQSLLVLACALASLLPSLCLGLLLRSASIGGSPASLMVRRLLEQSNATDLTVLNGSMLDTFFLPTVAYAAQGIEGNSSTYGNSLSSYHSPPLSAQQVLHQVLVAALMVLVCTGIVCQVKRRRSRSLDFEAALLKWNGETLLLKEDHAQTLCLHESTAETLQLKESRV